MKPSARPRVPLFSSGPCAKRPGWSPDVLKDAALGRSHRGKIGKAKLAEAIERTRALLGVPEDYRIGIVAASDTGAVEMALWSLLGPRGVDVLAWESFGKGWVSRRAQGAQAQGRARARGRLWRAARSEAGRFRARRGVHLERHDLGRARAERRLDPGRSPGPDHLRRDLGGVRDGHAVGQARCRHLFLAEGAGRRGAARHADPVAARRGPARVRTSRPGRCPRSSA